MKKRPDLARHPFTHVGVTVSVLQPGKPSTMYHAESGAGPEEGTILYPRDETALGHGAGVERETPSPHEAYAPFPHRRLGRPDGWDELPWS